MQETGLSPSYCFVFVNKPLTPADTLTILENAKGVRMSSQQAWHIPFHEDGISLRAALSTMPSPVIPEEMPLMLRLHRDPNLSFLGQLVSRAGLDQHQHDCIHLLLGRGLLPMDQAFVLGFTIGCSTKSSIPEHRLQGEVGRHFYKNVSLFDEAESAVFREGIKLAYLCCCVPLENFDFTPWYDQTLLQLRKATGIDPELVMAYYAIEKHRYPHSLASQRLLPDPVNIMAI